MTDCSSSLDAQQRCTQANHDTQLSACLSIPAALQLRKSMRYGREQTLGCHTQPPNPPHHCATLQCQAPCTCPALSHQLALCLQLRGAHVIYPCNDWNCIHASLPMTTQNCELHACLQTCSMYDGELLFAPQKTVCGNYAAPPQYIQNAATCTHGIHAEILSI